jgi:AraC family transcriptional regulator
MEKAAYKLWITSESVVDIALTVGFRNHETFSRAFRRHFHATPVELREAGRMGGRRRARKEERSPGTCVLSPIRYQVLRSMNLLAVRHVGGYSAISEPFSQGDRLWRQIAAWAKERHIPYYPAAVGIFYDNPWLTPEASQHADACLPIAHPIRAARTIRCLSIEGGEYGVIEHMGPRSTRWKAFRKLADAIHASDKYCFPAEPTGAMSITPLNVGELNRVEVYLKVTRKNRLPFSAASTGR